MTFDLIFAENYHEAFQSHIAQKSSSDIFEWTLFPILLSHSRKIPKMRGRTFYQWEKAWFLTFSWPWYWRKFFVLEEMSLTMALPETKSQLHKWSNMVMTISRLKSIRLTENKKIVHDFLKNLANFKTTPSSFTPYCSCFNKIFMVSVFQLSHFYLDAM